MNAERLLAHYEEIAEAPDAIARLRRFILDLAVRGKLVAQDPNDEPASELLRRVGVQFAQQVHDGKLNKPKPVTPISTSDYLFDLPGNWRWARFNEIASIQSNLVNPRQYQNMPHIAPDNIESWTARLLPYSTIKESGVFSGKHLFYAGAILYSKIRPNLAKATKVDFDGLCSADMYPIVALIDPDFLLKFMVSEAFVSQAVSEDNRLAMPKINQSALSEILVPVPPLAEQQRIAAKVNELMELCDHFEVSRTARDAMRDRLVAASLARLSAPDPETFQSDARFALDALPALTARPDQIKQLRQTILNLAVRGKLVPQDPNDEPAAELLRRTVSTKQIVRRSLVTISSANEPYSLPDTWKWASLDQLLVSGPQNGISPKPTNREDAPKAITLTATTSGIFDPACYKRVEAVIPEDSDFWLRDGDLLFQRGNTREYVGMSAIYRGPPNAFLFPDLMIKVRISAEVDLRFVHLASISQPARRFLSENASGAQATMPKINQSTLISLPIPLPPIAEQRRIVARVDELMALCDRLEAALAVADAGRRNLLNALLAEALAPAEDRELEAAE
ncbi:restriction endonuclease subunit S [Bradyrhizobium aeschynomenes]|uniref:restriction endonuclease subunit S n=1 Tax=Bradyrhizobium aeschynomenes TaxID=2734909 RepID=UPI0015536A96|nr:restriction endonuclease subunit S [Bradyrhizobium aeschynomenes]NPV23926.1 restriction endonuclease subunit S [Bradyrhizobium aeschynomenes]